MKKKGNNNTDIEKDQQDYNSVWPSLEDYEIADKIGVSLMTVKKVKAELLSED